MSRKLQSQIQSIKKMPGKYKRVLLAFAARANNDGTNIYAAMETLADDAGVSRWTVYRNADDLVSAGVLVEATSHRCSNPRCTGGARHYCGNGHWTRAFNIDRAILQNATQLVDLLRSKMPKSQCSKMHPSHVAKCDATQSLDSVLEDSSALTSGVSKKVTKMAADAASSNGNRFANGSRDGSAGSQVASPVSMGNDQPPVNPTEAPPPRANGDGAQFPSCKYQSEVEAKLGSDHLPFWALMHPEPMSYAGWTQDEVNACAKCWVIVESYGGIDPVPFLAWHRESKPAKYQFRSFVHMFSVLESGTDGANRLFRDFLNPRKTKTNGHACKSCGKRAAMRGSDECERCASLPAYRKMRTMEFETVTLSELGLDREDL